MNRATATKRLRAKHESAFHRPELTQQGDGIPRKASTGGTSPMVKVNPDQDLIDEALAKRCPDDILSAG